jgi:NADP-dependent 3-hydroxy acid dehydrogenase YdfG
MKPEQNGLDLEHAPGRGRLAGKVALVIGGGSIGAGWGNGKAAAVVYAREGAKVAVVDLREAAALETVDIIRAANGEAIALSGDMVSETDVARVVASVIEAWGRIDVLHNNVGGSGTGKSLANITLEDWNQTLARNLTSAMLTCRAVFPHMERSGGGSIVNISSVSSIRHLGTPTAVYSAAKGALNELKAHVSRSALIACFPAISIRHLFAATLAACPATGARASTARRSMPLRGTKSCPWAGWARAGTLLMQPCSSPATTAPT